MEEQEEHRKESAETGTGRTTGIQSGVGLAPALVSATTTARGVIMIVVTTGRGTIVAGTITGELWTTAWASVRAEADLLGTLC